MTTKGKYKLDALKSRLLAARGPQLSLFTTPDNLGLQVYIAFGNPGYSPWQVKRELRPCYQ